MGQDEDQVNERPLRWKRLWGWTEFGKRSGWDWLQLFIVPLAISVIGLWFTAQQDARQQQIENQRAASERELAEQRAQDEALQAYLGQMSTLLLEKNLRSPELGSEVRTLARARTLTVLGRLDPTRKTQVIQFLNEASLVQEAACCKEPVIALHEAPLRDVNVSGFDMSGALMSGADLSGADLSGTDLSGADLIGANLSDANLSGADLSGALMSDADLIGANGVTKEQLKAQAKTLGDATMPDGQRMPSEPKLLVLGPIPAGEYATDEFELSFRFEVGESWTAKGETADTLIISEPWPKRGHLFFTTPLQVFDPSNLSELKEVPAPENAAEWASWFQRHPNLETSKRLSVSVGGASTVQIDATPSSIPEDYPRDVCGEQPCVPLYPPIPISGLEEWKDRFVIADVKGETVVINVSAPAGEFDMFAPKAQKVLETVEWEEGA